MVVFGCLWLGRVCLESQTTQLEATSGGRFFGFREGAGGARRPGFFSNPIFGCCPPKKSGWGVSSRFLKGSLRVSQLLVGGGELAIG